MTPLIVGNFHIAKLWHINFFMCNESIDELCKLSSRWGSVDKLCKLSSRWGSVDKLCKLSVGGAQLMSSAN